MITELENVTERVVVSIFCSTNKTKKSNGGICFQTGFQDTPTAHV